MNIIYETCHEIMKLLLGEAADMEGVRTWESREIRIDQLGIYGGSFLFSANGQIGAIYSYGEDFMLPQSDDSATSRRRTRV